MSQGRVFVDSLQDHTIKVIQELNICSSFRRFAHERNTHVHPNLHVWDLDVSNFLEIWRECDQEFLEEFVKSFGKRFLMATEFIIKSAQVEPHRRRIEEILSFHAPNYRTSVLRRALFEKKTILCGEFPLNMLYEFFMDQVEFYVHTGDASDPSEAFGQATELLCATLDDYVHAKLPLDVLMHWKRFRSRLSQRSNLQEPKRIIPVLLKLLFRFIEGVLMVGDIPNAQVFTVNLISFEGKKLFVDLEQPKVRRINHVERRARHPSQSMIECAEYFGWLCSKSEEYKMNGDKADVTFIEIGMNEFVHKSNARWDEGLKRRDLEKNVRRCFDNYLQKVSAMLTNPPNQPNIVSFQTIVCPFTGTRKFYIQVGQWRRRVLSMRYIFKALCTANGIDPAEVDYPSEIPGGEHDDVLEKAMISKIEYMPFDDECQQHFRQDER